jgi:hypothetical protein
VSTLLDATESPSGLAEGEVVEVSLLLPSWQIHALEIAAYQRGLSAATMVRSLLRDFITGQSNATST